MFMSTSDVTPCETHLKCFSEPWLGFCAIATSGKAKEIKARPGCTLPPPPPVRGRGRARRRQLLSGENCRGRRLQREEASERAGR